MLAWYAQELQPSCVAACVRMALDGLGLQMAEAQVRYIIGHTSLGISLGAAQEMLVEAGAMAHLHDDWSQANPAQQHLRRGH